jgi:hypothetical protein
MSTTDGVQRPQTGDQHRSKPADIRRNTVAFAAGRTPQGTEAMPTTNTDDELRQRLAALREEALQLLTDCTANQGAACGMDLIVALQDVSNRLGAAQAALAPQAPPVLTPAAIEPSRRRQTRDTEVRSGVPAKSLTAEAAIVLGLAEITVPFAITRQDEAERWLRVLRQEGQVGAALQALGIDESPQLATRAEPRHPTDTARGRDAVRAIGEQAMELARERDGDHATTVDVLFAVIVAYGPLIDRTLYAAGAGRVELLDQLSGRAAVAHIR